MDVATVTFESDGTRCEADLHQPAGTPPWPVVVMAHGFGAARTWGLAPFAQRFARDGIAALVFDHRFHGASAGTPRRLIDPSAQLADWSAALSHARSMDRLDADRVALWGTSFSAGHALATAAGSSHVAAVVAQVPFVDGLATTAHTIRAQGLLQSLPLLGRALADQTAAVARRDPVEVPIVSRPGEGGLLATPGAWEGYRALVPSDERFVNRTPARVVLRLAVYRPGRHARRIQAPVHLVLAGEDRLLPVDATRRVVETLEDPSVDRIPAGHFAVYEDPWRSPILDRQVAFLAGALDADA